MPLDDEALREAASHRGLKLVKSRKRKLGVGDYGRFGLVDGAGRPLYGIGEEGLTATPEEIADYLRKGEASTWAESAKATPALSKAPATSSPVKASDDDGQAAIRPRPQKAATAARPAKASEHDSPMAAEQPSNGKAPPPPKTAPELAIRNARAADADALANLLASIGSGATTADIRRSIVAAAARGEPVFVANKGGIVGCLAWHIIPAFYDEPAVGITTLVVKEAERRQGIGGALYEVATAEWAQHGVTLVEAMSDIAVRNANGFYRAIGLEQLGYRFGRKI